MGRLGADVDELARLARSLEAAAETLSDDRRQVGTAVRRARWDGPDAERFRHDWAAVHGPSLDAIARSFEAAARTLRAEAQAQRSASGGEGGFPVDPTRPRYDGTPGAPGRPDDPQKVDQRPSAEDVGLGATVAGGIWDTVTSLPWVIARALDDLEAVGPTKGVGRWVFSGDSRDLDEAGDGDVGASLSALAVGTAAPRPLLQDMVDGRSPVGMLLTSPLLAVPGHVYHHATDEDLSEQVDSVAVDARDKALDLLGF